MLDFGFWILDEAQHVLKERGRRGPPVLFFNASDPREAPLRGMAAFLPSSCGWKAASAIHGCPEAATPILAIGVLDPCSWNGGLKPPWMATTAFRPSSCGKPACATPLPKEGTTNAQQGRNEQLFCHLFETNCDHSSPPLPNDSVSRDKGIKKQNNALFNHST